MGKIVIADSGSSKTHWCCVDRDNPLLHIEFHTEGLNPNYISLEEIASRIESYFPVVDSGGEVVCCAADCVGVDIAKRRMAGEGDEAERRVADGISRDEVSEAWFYGAGVSDLMQEPMTRMLKGVFPNAEKVEALSDMLGAARALLGKGSGLATILGTGMNSCLYDGRNIVQSIASLGFILGDEGSGGYIGKKLIGDFIRGNMPEEVRKLTSGAIGLTPDEIIREIYTKPSPNRFCAQYCKFVGRHIDDHPYFRNLVEDAFRAMFEAIITCYPNYNSYSFNCVGSVGYAFRDILREVCNEYGMTIGNIFRGPMDGLVKYHL
ncbi:MAG: N-acetylglucosamine kinase [Bacteroidales bacterium]|nr:N-acetylglucosamine kinase [Bacteroidales bacterium]